MYTIGNLIYGIPITQEACDYVEAAGVADPDAFEELQDWGFETFYDGSSEFEKGYCGVLLMSFNATEDMKVHELIMILSEEQIAEAVQAIANINPDLRNLCGEEGLWIVWSTS